MLQEIKKGLLTGFGAVLLTKDKIEDIARKISEEAHLDVEDSQKLKDELYAAGQRQWDEMDSVFTESVQKVMEKLDIAKQSKINDLDSKVANLEKRIMLLEDMMTAEEEA